MTQVNEKIFKLILKDVKDEVKDKLIMSMFNFLSNEYYGEDNLIDICIDNKFPETTVKKELLLFQTNKYEKENPFTIVENVVVNVPFNRIYYKVKRDGDSYSYNRDIAYSDLENISMQYAKAKTEEQQTKTKN